MKRLISLLLLLFALPCFAQTAPPTTTFSANTSVISLPNGKQTFAGVDSGITFSPTPNFDLLERNLISTGPGFQYFAGGTNYRIKPLSVGFNNMSSNVNGLRFQFGITESVGVVRITDSNGVTRQHYGFTGGGFVNYSLTQGGMFTMGATVEYAKFPGFANNTWIVKLSPAIHF